MRVLDSPIKKAQSNSFLLLIISAIAATLMESNLIYDSFVSEVLEITSIPGCGGNTVLLPD